MQPSALFAKQFGHVLDKTNDHHRRRTDDSDEKHYSHQRDKKVDQRVHPLILWLRPNFASNFRPEA